MDKNQIKQILNQGFGSPGETTRALTTEFRKLRATLNREEVCRKILKARALSYSSNGFEIIDDALLERILLKSDGEFPFIIFADIFASNNFSGQNKTDVLIDNLDAVLEVIVDNYNNLVLPVDECKTYDGLKLKAQEFVNEELDKTVFSSSKNDVVDDAWEKANATEEKDSNLWRKDVFGAWIYKSEYNKSTTYGWRIVTNQVHGTQKPFHWQNTERNNDGNIKCKIISKGDQNVKYNSGCYIATVCYGNPYTKEVIILRNFRDNHLSKNLIGRSFILCYYLISPTIAKTLKGHHKLNSLIRKYILDRIVEKVKQ